MSKDVTYVKLVEIRRHFIEVVMVDNSSTELDFFALSLEDLAVLAGLYIRHECLKGDTTRFVKSNLNGVTNG